MVYEYCEKNELKYEFELFELDSDIRDATFRGESLEEIRRLALSTGKLQPLIVAGAVLGISRNVVTPPLAQARLPVCRSSLWVSPGSRKWT